MNGARILLVGGEDGVARSWIDPLREAGANIAVVAEGSSGVRHLAVVEPELIMVDLLLAGPLDGLDTCRALRACTPTVIVVAAPRAGAFDEVAALAVGADHIVAAGTPAEVVTARVRSLIRRSRGTVVVGGEASAERAVPPRAVPGHTSGRLGAHSGAQTSTQTSTQKGAQIGTRNGGLNGALHPLRGGGASAASSLAPGPAAGLRGTGAATAVAVLGATVEPDVTERIVEGDLEIDLVSREVRVAGVLAALTRIEFDLLVTLARHPRRVFTREQLMASAWDEPFDGSHVLDAHLSRLRGKIGEAGGQRVAHAVRGVGFRLRA